MDKKEKIEYLEGIRGLGAVMVMMSHFMVGFYPALYSGNVAEIHTVNGIELAIVKSPLNIIYGGNFAVCIFFILSGYVLTYKYFKTYEQSIIIASASKRYLRLLLPVAFSVLFSYILMRFSLYYNQQAAILSNSNWWLSSFWTFEPKLLNALKDSVWGVFFNGDWAYNNVLWTMVYEFKGSFLVFMIAILFGRLKNRFIIYSIIICFFINTYYCAFIIGLTLCDLHTRRGMDSYKLKGKISVMLIFIIGLFLGSYPPGIQTQGTIYEILNISIINDKMMFYHIIGATFIIIALLNSRSMQIFFSTRLMKKLGELSFSIYVIHLPIIGSVSSYIFINLPSNITYFSRFIIMIILSIITIFIASECITKYIDKSGVKIANYVYEKYLE